MWTQGKDFTLLSRLTSRIISLSIVIPKGQNTQVYHRLATASLASRRSIVILYVQSSLMLFIVLFLSCISLAVAAMFSQCSTFHLESAAQCVESPTFIPLKPLSSCLITSNPTRVSHHEELTILRASSLRLRSLADMNPNWSSGRNMVNPVNLEIKSKY